jgi:sugar phosphate isomerase/epimerase
MLLGYNTNGFAFHRLDDAIEILHEIGYRAVGLTLDYNALNPFEAGVEDEARRIGKRLQAKGMRCVVETGARFLLDPRRKHQPTLVSSAAADRERRADFLCRAVRLAAILSADAVSFWSGAPLDVADAGACNARLIGALKPVLSESHRLGVRLALESEPGMLVDSVAAGKEVLDRVGDSQLGLTIDVGHLHCQSEGDIPDILKKAAAFCWNVHIEDMRRGVHDHLMFGEGEMNFPPILAALESMGYSGGVYVELSRHAHDAVAAAKKAFEFLNAGLGKVIRA